MTETRTDPRRVGVVGLGYVGLPLALTMADAGYRVTGVDVDPDRVEQLNAGESYVSDVGDAWLRRHTGTGEFEATTDYEALRGASCVSVCVPTPLRKSGRPDVSYVVDASERLAACLSRGSTVVLESTVYPGATEEIIAPMLEEEGFEVGEDVSVAFSPERIDPGNETYDPVDIPKVLGGVTPRCGDRAEATYERAFDEVVRVGSSTEAELVKLLENTFRSVNIALINELATVADEMGADIWEVVDAAATKPFGFMPFYPGPGLGGHCIPVDPMYLSWKANQHGVRTRFIDLADQVNREMPEHVVRRVSALLNDDGVALSTADVLVLGASYKPEVSDTRESPALDIISLLAERGSTVTYHDPYVPTVEIGETTYESTELTPDVLRKQDCVLVVTDHDALPLERVVEHARLVFDTRNATAGLSDESHVVRL
ncbi:MAG: nucleotide sugar dehydrogenase [Salinirussus sp.]